MRHYIFGEELLKQKDIRYYGFALPYDFNDRTHLRRMICAMIHRCHDERDKYYAIYGGRGITVCPQWRNPETGKPDYRGFYKWCIEAGWRRGTQIDRIDNDKGYFPENCRFVEPKVNCRNRSTNRMMTLKGETKSMAEWAEVLGMSYKAIEHRVNRGMSDEEALTKNVSVGNTKFITYDGRNKSIKDWASEIGMSSNVLGRYLKKGMTIGDVLERRRMLGKNKVDMLH